MITEEECRKTVNGHASLDLHGATVAEALEIVQEIICDTPPTKGGKTSHSLSQSLLKFVSLAANPLRVITGRGAHSANGIGVLRPALKNRLTELGWNVNLFDGGLVVHG